jgi:hypothetical protein
MPGGRYSVWALLPETSDFTVEAAIAHFGKLRFGKEKIQAEPASPRGKRKFPGFRVLFGDWAVSVWLESGDSVLVDSADIAEGDDLPASAEVIASCARRLAVISDKDSKLIYADHIGLVMDELRERFGAFNYDHVQDEWWL